MSHSVTITRTTTSSTNTSYIVLNTGYLKSFSGLLKLFQLLIGIAMVTLMAMNYNPTRAWFAGHPDLFVYLMATTFTIATFCLLLACLTSLSTGGLIAKTIFELIYHSVAAILLLACSLNFIIELTNSNYKRYDSYNTFMAISILGLVNCVLYFISAFLAHRSYRGI